MSDCDVIRVPLSTGQMASPHTPMSADGRQSALWERLRTLWSQADPERRRKVVGLLLAVAVEALLILLLFSLGIVRREAVPMRDSLVTVTVSEATEAEEPAPAPAEVPDAASTETRASAPQPERDVPQATTPPRATPAPALIPVSPQGMRNFDIARAPPARPAPGAQAFGPVDTPRPGDSQRIAGSGPNGEPLYAARWYREPSDDELRGYLSTASGPGWALINCRTAPQFRVEDCELVGEAPQGSNMGRAVLAAAWQFKVRPPQIGGRPQVGEWVRIRIEYRIGPAAPAFAR